MVPINRWLGKFHYRERHSIEIRADCRDVYQALNEIDLGDSRLIRLLFMLRGLPRFDRGGGAARSALPMHEFLQLFTPLWRDAPAALVVGAAGRFWRAGGGMVPLTAEHFAQFCEPGVAKLVMAFWTTPLLEGYTRLSTETRVWCTDAAARRRFRWYWYLIRPASGLIRREMLRLTKQRAENRGAGTRGC